MRPSRRRTLLLLGATLCLGAAALTLHRRTVAQGGLEIDVPSDGSDGILDLATTTTIDLSQAVTSTWDTPSPQPGLGVYDPEKWAVVFKYSSVNISSSATVSFTNHPSGAPVVWLVDGDVRIDGWIDVRSRGPVLFNAQASKVPGPGGFRGGLSRTLPPIIDSAGFGPGKGRRVGEESGAGSNELAGDAPSLEPYSNARAVPLIGGSGGAGKGGYQGGAGGGAILIAARGTITLNGQIFADGDQATSGSGGGGGGTVRMIGASIVGIGRALARGLGGGGDGQVRLESFSMPTVPNGSFIPMFDWQPTQNPPLIWPPASTPALRVASVSSPTIGTLLAPADPRAGGFPDADVIVDTEDEVTVTIEGTDVPLDATVRLLVTPRTGDDLVIDAALVAGSTEAASQWQAVFTPAQGFSALQARADLP